MIKDQTNADSDKCKPVAEGCGLAGLVPWVEDGLVGMNMCADGLMGECGRMLSGQALIAWMRFSREFYVVGL